MIYPRIYKLSDIFKENFDHYTNEETYTPNKPLCIPATVEKILLDDIYIMDNGEVIYLFVG